MRRGIRNWLLYSLLFYILIVYWECLLQLPSCGSLRAMRGWFLLFALPQALLPASLCGRSRKRRGRLCALFAALPLALFYAAHMIYYRIFGSMISLSMIGVGGDAVENFGWALRATLRESVGWLLLLALPLAALLVWRFLPRPRAGRSPFLLRAVTPLLFALLWLGAAAALRLGGSSEASAWYAYRASLVDTDTSAQQLGVLTTSELEAWHMLFGSRGGDEGAMAVGESAELLLPSLPGAPPEETPSEAQAAPAPPEETEGAEAEAVEPTEEAAPAPPSRHIFEEIDFNALAAETDDETIRGLCAYFAARPGTGSNAYTGLLRDCSLIYICAESFSTLSISEEITPTLWRMAHEGVVLNNYYNSFKNTTTNGEYALLTGLWPDVSRQSDLGSTKGSFAQSAGNYMPFGLGHLFAGQGVKSYMFHNYYGDYYNRVETHANLGYVCRFRDSMELSELWPASDLEMMQQTVDDFIGDERFNVYYMTFSGHGPYIKNSNIICRRNFDAVPESADGRRLTVRERCFYASSLELERAVEYLLGRLEEAGKLDKTLIVLAGDHYPYYLTDEVARSLCGGKLPETRFERYRSTCILWSGAIREPIEVDAPCCNVDVLPTVLNLLGIDYDSRLLSGTDILSDAEHVAVLSNRDFVTESVKYSTLNGSWTRVGDGAAIGDAEMNACVERIRSEVKARYAAALAINKTDFYRFVWEKSGLPMYGNEGPGGAGT